MRTSLLTLASLLTATISVLAQGEKDAKASSVTETKGTTTTTTNPAAATSGVEVGIARRDGVSFSSGETYVSRNGVMEKLVKELALPGGVKVAPDGTVTMADGKQFRLRADQTITLGGVVQTIPVAPVTSTPVQTRVEVVAPAAVTATPAVPKGDSNQATISGTQTPNTPGRLGEGLQAK